MASSNKHWPSMFKSKPCNTHHQWQHDINQSLCHKSPYASGCEERSPEPKPRWNPKPEQIRILEAIFNSGMVNPPREEIRKIRSQLQAYGQVGDANVFYWFQNRKSRSKHKLRHQLQSAKSQCQNPNPNPNPKPTSLATNAPSSSSSSSEKSSPKAAATADESGFASAGFATESATDVQHHHFFGEPFFFPLAQYSSPPSTVAGQSYAHNDLMMIPNPDQSDHHNNHEAPPSIGPCTSLLLSEIMNNSHGGSKKQFEHHQIEKDFHNTPQTAAMATLTGPSSERIVPSSAARGGNTNVSGAPVTSVINHVHAGEEEGPGVGPGAGNSKTTVFINDVAFEVPAVAFNVREAFGEGAVLFNSYGQPVLTDEWGLTLQSLHHGAFYYLI